MRFAYADPPYLGCCHQYGHRHEQPYGCWDELATHRHLIDRLVADFPDGWAMSATSVSLRQVLPLCPENVRIAAWCKPFAPWLLGGRPTRAPYTWEPVIYATRSERERTKRLGVLCRDFTLASPPLKQRIRGEKPPGFSWWVFSLLGAGPDDELVDVFPGSGAVGEAWRAWCGEWNTTGTLFEGSGEGTGGGQ